MTAMMMIIIIIWAMGTFLEQLKIRIPGKKKPIPMSKNLVIIM